MEVVLQWLDDLDDLVFAVALSWRSASRLSLALGFGAALVLTPIYSSELPVMSVAALSVVAGCSVLAWLAAALITIRRQPAEVAPAA